jgi:hypothetical protein
MARVVHRVAAAATAPSTSLHYTANGNFSSSGTYEPGTLKFNVADISSAGDLSLIPSGDHAFVFVGMCAGSSDTTANAFGYTWSDFTSLVTSTITSSAVIGYYIMDEPDPETDNGAGQPYCDPAKLLQETQFINGQKSGEINWMIDQNLGSPNSPTFSPATAGHPGVAYTLANTGLSDIALDPYPCRTEVTGCGGFTMVSKYVKAAESTTSGAPGIPKAHLVPVYQAFGGGNWGGDGEGGNYKLPSAAQERTLMSTWAKYLPAPAFDYAYSWGVQNSDTALTDAPTGLRAVFASHNGTAAPRDHPRDS